MILPAVTTVDFETLGIGPRPNEYPPRPVGVAFRWPDGTKEYLCWESKHGDTNCTKDEAHRALDRAWRGPVLFHHAGFDTEVAMTHLGMPYPRDWHDTLFLLFLHEPHAKTFSLKPSAERILNMPPEQQDLLREWILANVPGATAKNFGAFICEAPVSIVGPYAIGDVDRTFKLFERLFPHIYGMMPDAYNRERNLMPWLVDAERRGVRMNRHLLMDWEAQLDKAVTTIDGRLCAMFKSAVNMDSNDEVADALEKAGLITQWELTATGRRSTSKHALARVCRDPVVVAALLYRNTAATMLRTFVSPWLRQSAADGRLHTSWLQVRGVDGNGTRTGRIGSAAPNLANVFGTENLPALLEYPALPNLRSAFLPDEGERWVCKDYTQQELRITAHFEDGALLRAYNDNPDIDFHDLARQMILSITGIVLTRKATKTTGFAILYGAGNQLLAEQLGISEDEAMHVRNAYFRGMPGLRALYTRIRQKVDTIGVVKSLGGRLIPNEPPSINKQGMLQTFGYKMLNKLVQGSAADQTKQAIIDFCHAGSGGRLLTTVYDEINISALSDRDGVALEHAMVAGLKCDVPMRTSTKTGLNWGELK